MTDSFASAKIKPWHRRRLAIDYVRQSSLQQVAENHESTARQYALVDRAVALGWPRERVIVIDDDLGKSGQSAEGRPGFQRLLAEVALDHVGLILGLEMSRLARSCKDWHNLLELCARFHTLLADADGLYDPTDYNDRLLLGLKGTMSEAELHLLKQRLHQGMLNKARRGELFHHAPSGYAKLSSSELAIDPDQQAQAVVRLVFDEFDRQQTVHGLLRYLVANQVLIPVRVPGGSSRGQLEWHRPNQNLLRRMLRHPIYAGAYRYGHRSEDEPQRPGRRGKQIRKPEETLVLLKDRLPAYISWERYCANQQRLDANRNRPDTVGAPRQGLALLGGLIYCGRCGRRMQVRYSGRKQVPHYVCARAFAIYGEPFCQNLSGTVIDELVAEQILVAVEPAALEASLAAVADVEAQRADLARQWQLRLERIAYEADRAERQYQACEPENRLVARTLERRWEEALRKQQQLQEQFERWQQSAPVRLSEADRQAIRVLASDLPALWQAPTTTPADRKRVARLLLERVVATVDKKSERVDVELHWLGGQVCRHQLSRPVSRYEQQADYPRLVRRLKQLCQQRLSHKEMAERLNQEGFRPAKRAEQFSVQMVLGLLRRLGLSGLERHGSAAGLGRDEYRPHGLARRLGVPRETVRNWLRAGWVTARRDEAGHHIIWADAEELRRLRELSSLPRTWENRERLAELKKPKQRPK